MKQNVLIVFFLFLTGSVWSQQKKDISLYDFRWEFRSSFELSTYIQDQKDSVPGLDNVYKITTEEGRIYTIGNQGFRFDLDQDSFDFSFDWTEKFVLSNGNYYRGYPLHTYPVEKQKQVVLKADSLLKSYFLTKPEFIPGLLAGHNDLSLELKKLYSLIMDCAVKDTLPNVYICTRGNVKARLKHTDDQLVIVLEQFGTVNMHSFAYSWDTKLPIELGRHALCADCHDFKGVTVENLSKGIRLFQGEIPYLSADTTGSKGYISCRLYMYGKCLILYQALFLKSPLTPLY